jgi:hypothetical protein
MEMERLKKAGGSKRRGTSLIWKALWKLQLPNAEKVWFWRACQDFFPTKDNLFRRKVVDDPNCPICEREKETIYHTLWQCPSAQDVWSGSCSKIQKSSFLSLDFLRVAKELWTKCDTEEFHLFLVTTRRL